LVGIVVFVGIIGGSYPAFYLSGFNPVNVLKGKTCVKGGSVVFRKILVVKQFAISIFMLISTLIVYNQLQYIRNKDLGI
jgi:putative ABC transport system permease protein